MFTTSLYEKIKLGYYQKELDFLRRSQFFSYDEIRSYQFNKIKKLLAHAYQNVPYYTRVFNELGLTPEDFKAHADLAMLPVLTKDIIRENGDDMHAVNMTKDEFVENSTGGSTGQPLQFYQDKQFHVWADAARVRGLYHMTGCEFGETTAVLWGAMHEIKVDYTFKERVSEYLKTGQIFLNAFNLSDKRKFDFLRWCKFVRPKILRGYVTAVKDFAVFLDENNIEFPKLKAIVLGAETVNENDKEYIEKIFKTKTFNTYGGRELSLIAMECPHHKGLHEVSENNYIEFEGIELNGYENAGNLLITNLNNYAMPFIRYRIGDIGVPSEEKLCTCGRGLPLIKKVIGRTTEVFVFRDGTRIAGEMFIHLMKDFGINEYQFVQVSDSKIELRIKSSDNIDNKLRKSLIDTYEKYLPEDVLLEFVEVEGFSKTPTGKFRFVFQECE